MVLRLLVRACRDVFIRPTPSRHSCNIHPPFSLVTLQGGRSWRASGDHQISLTVLAQSAFLQIFATKTPYAYLSLTMVNDKYALTESKSHSVSMHICHWLWSMTNMHSLSLNHTQCPCTFVIDYGKWQICRLLSLTHTQRSCIFVIDYGQWQICTTGCLETGLSSAS